MTGPIAPKPPLSRALVDLLPALRWGDPGRLEPLLQHHRLPKAWWSGASLADVTATIGDEEVALLAARVLHTCWPYLALHDALPPLCFCPEGQEADLSATVGATAAGAEGEAAVARLVRPLLRPFLTGGHSLGDTASGTEPDTTSEPDVRSLTALLVRLLPADTPPEIRSAAHSLAAWAIDRSEDADASGHAEGEEPAPSPEPVPAAPPAPRAAGLAALEGLFRDWDERQLAVAAGRTFCQNRVSLENLGARFNVSRERIRQIQVELEKRFQLWLTGQGRPFLDHLLHLQNVLGSVATEAHVRELHPTHEQAVPVLGLPLWQLIASSLPDRTWTNGWLVEGDLDERVEQTRAELTQLCAESAPTWGEAVEVLARLGVREAVAREWLRAVKGFRVIDGHLLPWGRSVNDRAEAVLTFVGRPLAAEELLTRLDDGTALASLRNQIQTDERFMRCDRDLYGLRRWGGVEYLGIREMIIRELERAGGEARSEDIVTALCSNFDVSDRSVRAYLAAPEFERFQRGWVRLAAPVEAGPADYQPRRDVAQTRRCFQTGQGTWCYRLDVNAEHLRGSGFTIPAGFAAHLGLAPGGRLELTHAMGDIQLVWRNQPTCGSLRPLLESMEAVEGDHVFLAAKEGQLKALRLAGEAELGLPDVQRALQLMALSGQVPEERMPEVLGRRIGLAHATSMDEVLAHLRIRGDKDVLELLSPQYAAPVTDHPVPGDEQSVPVAPPEETGGEEVRRDPAWGTEILPLLKEDAEAEADLIRLAEVLAARGKAAPVFGYELGEGGWQADFAWDREDAKVAVVPAIPHGSTDPDAERRDAAYRGAGWTVRSAVEWLERLDELLALLPDAPPGG
ncbi:hypothetical protein [Streptomyces sp. NPDC013181]|uniref:hypothetical protein n=1 Tax=Streptomyces sp. NPDC013181 TaxID=3364864 RepID=UPI003674577D